MVSNITVQSYFSVLCLTGATLRFQDFGKLRRLKVWLLGAVFVVNACFST